MKNFISEFIPIVAIFLLISYPSTIASLSHTILGRFLFLSILIFYSFLDKYLGLLVCGIILFYYHLEYVEAFEYEEPVEVDNGIYISDENNHIFVLNKSNQTSDIRSYNLVYPKEESAKSNFRKQYCINEMLTYKNNAVKKEMAEHVFPEIVFPENTCNPCSPTCNFSIIVEKIQTEEKMKPISTLP